MTEMNSVYDESIAYAFRKTLLSPGLRPVTIRCMASIVYNFFLCQYKAAWLPGRIPVSKVDHKLDEKIPFTPAWVYIYLDFVTFWIRVLSFLLRNYGRRAFKEVREFLTAMNKLYAHAGDVYQKNLSTTRRPFYISRPRFLVIHMLDPHLMCIPSLHVMVVILTYTRFAAMLDSLHEAEHCSAQINEIKQGALAITRAILFVKQHSVNCIPAALYAMTCFNEKLFPPEEAESFTNLLFNDLPVPADTNLKRPQKNIKMHPSAAPRIKIPKEDIAEIKAHIIGLYRHFLAQGVNAKSWEEPLLQFLREQPQA